MDDDRITLTLIVPPALQELRTVELAAWAATAGFDAIDAEAHHDATVAAALRDRGLGLGPMRIRASLADSDAAARAAAVETTQRAIDLATDLGLTTVWTLPRNFRNDASQRANFAVATASLAAVADHAARRGVRVAIENCPFEGQNPVCTPEAWDALFARIPAEALGLCMDPSHCVWQGIDYLRATREYAARIYHVHAKDTELLPEGRYGYGVAGPQIEEPADEDGWPRHGWWRHRLPGLGAVDWNAFLTALADIGYGGRSASNTRTRSGAAAQSACSAASPRRAPTSNGSSHDPAEEPRMEAEQPMIGDRTWPLGCQARPWLQTWGRDGLRARLPEVMARIGEIGFAGFETTIACLPLDDPPGFAASSARANGLVLCGAHAGGAWWDPASAAGIAPLVEQAGRLPSLGCTRLVVSMQPLPSAATDEHLRHIADNLGRLGRACRAAGDVQVVFHNHAAEVADDARVIAAIVERCAPEDVALGPDLGWVAHAGTDVTVFLQRFGARVAYLHVRDVTAYGSPGRFLEVGRGTLDYRGILSALDAAGFDGWLVAESEFGDAWQGSTEPEETVAAQFRGLVAATGSD